MRLVLWFHGVIGNTVDSDSTIFGSSPNGTAKFILKSIRQEWGWLQPPQGWSYLLPLIAEMIGIIG